MTGNANRVCSTCDCFGVLLFIGEPCVIRISSLAPRPVMCVCCRLPCNTANPEQRYQVHQTHTNYRQLMCATLPLVVGVIPATPLNCLLCLFALLSVIAGSRTNPQLSANTS